MYFIYKHTSPNNEVYIGQTKQNPTNRWDEGFGYIGEGKTKFAKAILKYGWENFSHEIVEDNIQTLEEANEKEIYWINFYDSYKNGLNSTLGGSGFHEGRKVVKIDFQTLEPICTYPSIKAAAREFGGASSQYIKKCCDRISLSSHGYYWCYEDEYTEEWKPINKKLYSSGNERPVLQICPNTLNILYKYNSVTEAQETIGVKTISACVRGGQKTAAGFYWCYEDEYANWKEPSKRKNFNKKAIYQISEGQIINSFDSIASAAKELNMDASHLAKSVKYNKKAYGFYWAYKKD